MNKRKSNQIYYIRHKKSILIKLWKKRGILSNDWDSLYQNYITTNNCNKCNILFDKGTYKRCLDHDHNTKLFRMVLCNRCNLFQDRQTNTNNSSEYPNVLYNKERNNWVIQIRRFKKSIVIKHFKSKYDAIIYRWLLQELHDI